MTARALALTALLVGATMIIAPTAPAEGTRMLGGMALGDVNDLKAEGVTPDLGSTWVGVWSKDRWENVDRTLVRSREQGVTPVIQWYYWGDDISPECVQNGCWSNLHNAWKSRDDWNSMATTLAKKVHSNLGNRLAIVVLETEFNKGGVEKWEPFDGYLEAQARIFREHAPNARLVLGFGSWGYSNYHTFDRAIGATDWLGYQDLAGSTRDSDAKMRGSVQKLIDTSRFLHETWGKPTFLAHWAVSSYPEPKYAGLQEELVKEFFQRLPELEAVGTKGFVYRNLHDVPTMDTNNYYGVAERHWGFIRADGSHKPALDDWLRGLKAVKAGVKSVPGTIEGEDFTTSTTGKDVYDGSASGKRAWLLWSNGHVQTNVASSYSGSHTFTFRASGTPAAGDWPIMVASLDDVVIGRWEVPSTSYYEYAVDVNLDAGDASRLRVAFVNDRSTSTEDRNLRLDKVTITATETDAAQPAPSPSPGADVSMVREAEGMPVKSTGGRMGDGSASGHAAWNLWSNGHVQDRVNVPDTGTYKIDVKAKGTPAAGTWPLMSITVDGREVQSFHVKTRDQYWSFGAFTTLTSGWHDVRVAFMNDHYDSRSGEDRNLHVDVVRIEKAGASKGTIEAEDMTTKTTGGRFGDGRASGGAAWNLWSNGHVEDVVRTSRDGHVTFTVKAKGTPADDKSPLMALTVDGKKYHYYVNARDAYWSYSKTVWLPAGEHDVRVGFENDLRTSTGDRNLHVDAVHWALD